MRIGSDIVPMEVKTGERIRAAGLKEYIDRYAPRKAILISRRDPRNGPAIHLPLPLMWMFGTIAGME